MNINVGIGDLTVSKAPFILETRGLGSCVGVTLYDNKKKIGALAHIMLPRITSSIKENANENMKFRYAEYALPYMLNKMFFMGSERKDIVAKIVGGASMFKRKSGTLNIGEKNIEAVKTFLKNNFIKVQAEEVGGDMGRTIFFDLNNGVVIMRIYGKVKQEVKI